MKPVELILLDFTSLQFRLICLKNLIKQVPISYSTVLIVIFDFGDRGRWKIVRLVLSCCNHIYPDVGACLHWT